MLLEDIILFTSLALICEVIGTISGFGSSVFFVPVASMFFDFHSVLGITAVFHVFSNLTKIIMFRKGVDWRIVLYLGLPSVVFVSIGAFISKFIESSFLQIFLSIFLIFFSLLFLVMKELNLKPTKLNAILGGSSSGFIAGLVGTGGAIRGITLAAFNLPKDVFIATSALIDFGVDLSRGFVYYSNGFIHEHDYKYIAILLLVSVVGTYLGKISLKKISEKTFRKIVLYTILCIGVATIAGFIYKS